MAEAHVLETEYLAVGEIVRPQGVRGELKVKPLTDDPDRFFDLSRVRVGDDAEQRLHCLRVNGGFVYIRLENVYSREAAEALRGTLLYVRRSDAVALPPDTDFICDLIGCVATDTEGKAHGVLVDILQPGGADVYVFRSDAGDLMVPALKKTMLKVDVSQKQILLCAQSLRETAVYS